MNNYSEVFSGVKKEVDPGLRQYLLMIYNYLAMGLGLTGVTAVLALSFPPLTHMLFHISPTGQFLGTTGFGTAINFAPLGIAIWLIWGGINLELRKAQILYWTYTALTGLSLSSLGFIYTGESIARTFFICAGAFAGMSIYGYTTKRDLTSMGSFMIQGLIGLIIASFANFLLQSPAINFALSVIGVVIFLGLIAWDTQKLKTIYYQVGGGLLGQKMAVLGALELYLDFINLFLYLLRFLGVRRND